MDIYKHIQQLGGLEYIVVCQQGQVTMHITTRVLLHVTYEY